MKGGFCQRAASEYNGEYYTGPSLDGSRTFVIAEDIFRSITKSAFLGKHPLFLAGHSRGGAAVIYVAQKLQKIGVSVDGMFLFDAVDRTLRRDVNVQMVPRNVKATYHARRNVALNSYFENGLISSRKKYRDSFSSFANVNPADRDDILKQYIKYIRLDNAMRVRMRSDNIASLEGLGIDFSNCGIGVAAPCSADEARLPCRYSEAFFLGSHGALGGSPIGEQDGAWASKRDQALFDVIRQNDRAAMADVWSWMQSCFSEARLGLHNAARTEMAARK